jgi:nicotinamide-nucleotide amidase
VSAAPTVDDLVARIGAGLTRRGATMAAAESCTGGLIAAACTARAGSSAWFERGVVTYSNAAKTELLAVAATLIAAHGAVSAEVARAMAAGLLERSPARFTVAVTGIAGPDGGTPLKPVGTVWIATAGRGGATEATLLNAPGDRAAVRERSVARALELLLARIEAQPAPPR